MKREHVLIGAGLAVLVYLAWRGRLGTASAAPASVAPIRNVVRRLPPIMAVADDPPGQTAPIALEPSPTLPSVTLGTADDAEPFGDWPIDARDRSSWEI